MERMSEDRLTKKVYVSHVKGNKKGKRLNWRWKVDVEKMQKLMDYSVTSHDGSLPD